MSSARDFAAEPGALRQDAVAIASVSDTARWAAIYRADESARADALFDDPYAARLAGARGVAIAARAPRQMLGGWQVVARTVAIDGLVRSAVAEGCDRVLCLAAGLDMRPYRLALPASLTWIEADLPAVIEEKQRILVGEAATCRVTRESVDLADPSARGAFLDRALAGAARALIITEGLLTYLDDAVVEALVHDLARPEVKGWVFRYPQPRDPQHGDESDERRFGQRPDAVCAAKRRRLFRGARLAAGRYRLGVCRGGAAWTPTVVLASAGAPAIAATRSTAIGRRALVGGRALRTPGRLSRELRGGGRIKPPRERRDDGRTPLRRHGVDIGDR